MFCAITSEVRWFFQLSSHEPIVKWFQELDGLYEKQIPRYDIYIRQKNDGSTGIKFREGRFEIKQMQKELGILKTESSVSGKAEQWEKWSFDLNQQDLQPIEKSRNWISISKARLLQKFIIKNGILTGGFDHFHSDGCNAEITKVDSYSSDDFKSSDDCMANELSSWWTLGLETYGNPDLQSFNLLAAFDHIFKDGFPIKLSDKNSLSYPEWLSKFNQL